MRRRRGLRPERRTLIRWYAGWSGYDVMLAKIGHAVESVSNMPTRNIAERIEKANALTVALSEIPRPRAPRATPERA